ncbi:hypothetical protein F5B18DRAFT_320888 [Nemania serpens]|nr:hypothetical protein F5B18DRAFT_320888 [Nemania serpens]
MASCQKYFKDPREMLRHLKKCDFFSDGKFWCPTCDQVDSFKVVSNKKCSWDRVNLARKLIQKSLKVLQGIASYQSRARQALSGSLCANCLNTVSPDSYFGSSQELPSKFPTPYTKFDFQFHPAESWELPVPLSELCQMPPLSDSMSAQGPSRHPFQLGIQGPGTAAQQMISPSELSAVSLGQSIYSSDIASASASHTNDSPMLGSLQFCNNNPVTTAPILPTRQVSRRGQMPPLTVDTHQSLSSMPAPDWGFNMLLGEGETLDPSSGIDVQGMVNLTPIIITPEGSEDTPSVRNGSSISHDNTHMHPSPSLSFPSSSNTDFSPTSVSSTPELQCDYAGCEFKPKRNLAAYFRKHLTVHENKKIPCPYCGKTFSRRDNLTAHTRRAHAAVADEPPLKRRRENSGSPEPRAS